MRIALQRLLANPSALTLLRSLVQSQSYPYCLHKSSCRALNEGARKIEPQRDLTTIHASKKQDVRGLSEVTTQELDKEWQRVEKNTRPGFSQSSGTARERRKSWETHLSTFDQYQYESTPKLSGSQDERLRLIDNPGYADDWSLWLELIRFRKRHHGSGHTVKLYKEILQKQLEIPTRGDVAKELWDRLIQAGHSDSKFMEEVIYYATELRRRTGEAWSRMYVSIVGHALKADPGSALSWHGRLKSHFPPSVEEYKKLFTLSVSWGTISSFRAIYEDLPLPGLYGSAIPELCNLQMYEEAINWHHILFSANDLPSTFSELRPLLAYFAQSGNDHQIERITRALIEAEVSFSRIAELFVRQRKAISREIMNRQLGEVHGVAPKNLSDSFCARLFATRLFSVDTVIRGLQMMAVETIGPLSLREIASRDGCNAIAFCRHVDLLKEADVSLDKSLFSTIVRKLALENNTKLLRSIVECDLHPDTFEDFNLQEKLLAQYHEKDDQLQIERTLAVLTAGCSEKDLDKVRCNVLLRSHVTLRNKDVVVTILEKMERTRIPVTSRSSRHLRVCWLSSRVPGGKALSTQELTILIYALRGTLQSGGFMPVKAWYEILRRLGMAGRLVEFENLALWLADWYTSPAGYVSTFNKKLWIDRFLPSEPESDLGQSPQTSKIEPRIRNKQLDILFPTNTAQSAIVAWGFQLHSEQSLMGDRLLRRNWATPSRDRPQWAWGLELLRKLRERGVSVRKPAVARFCRQRLNALFGNKISSRAINQRAKEFNDWRLHFHDRYSRAAYIREMKKIWGDDLFVNRRLKNRCAKELI